MAGREFKFRPLEPIVAQGAAVGLGEAIGAGFDSARFQGIPRASQRQAEGNGVYQDVFRSMARPEWQFPPDLATSIAEQGFEPDAGTLERVNEWIGSEGPRLGLELTDDYNPAMVIARREEVRARDQSLLEAEQEVLSRAPGGTRLTGELIGGVGAEMLDPINLMTLPVGAPGRVGFLATLGIEAGLNAFIEAAETGARNEIARELGQEETSMGQNALIGALFGGAMVTGMKGMELTATKAADLAGRYFSRPAERREIARDAVAKSDDPEVAVVADRVIRDADDQQAAGGDASPEAGREDAQRTAAATVAAEQGGLPDIPDRPTTTRPTAALTPGGTILNGALEEVNPAELNIEPGVFQFKSDADAGGVTDKLRNVTTWEPSFSGTVIVFEYADGSRSIVDGHQRTALARRIMAEDPAQQIRLAANVFREEEGWTTQRITELAALKNIAESADGMTMKMARDAAKVLRLNPEALANLPRGTGIGRAQNLSALGDDAFALVINDVVPDNLAALVGRMVPDPKMQMAMMRLLERTRPGTEAQAENILRQALASPIEREITEDLFGAEEIAESLFIERAKVLERAMQLLRSDRGTFRTLVERGDAIQGVGSNKLDQTTNEAIREQTEQALIAADKLAYRAGPISEALDNGAKTYKGNGRLGDAAANVVDAIRAELAANGLAGGGLGVSRRDAEPQDPGTPTPDPNEGFADPINGPGVDQQIAATRMEPRVAAGERANDPSAATATEDDGTAPENIFMPIDETATPAEQLAQISAMTEENKPIVARIMQIVDEKFGTKSSDNVKELEKVALKADRPSILAKKPWFTIGHIRDSYRFKTILDTLDDVPAIFDVLLKSGVSIVKVDTGKMFDPGIWGWRIIAFDLRMPNGQIVEWYLPLKNMEAQKKAEGHLIFEDWRDKSDAEIHSDPAVEAEYDAAIQKSLEGYNKAFAGDLARAGQSVEEAKASWANSESSILDAARRSPSSSGEIMSAGVRDLENQAPSGPRFIAGASEKNSSARDVPGSIKADDGVGIDNTTPKPDVSIPEGNRKRDEQTPAGSQMLIDGVDPITPRDRLQAAADRPLLAQTRRSDSEIGGMFDPQGDDLFDMVPVGVSRDADGVEAVDTISRADLEAELTADDDFADQLGFCMK